MNNNNNKKYVQNNPHAFHRQRLRKRFINEGLQNFEKHNILELLLFYSIPRKDTNDIAHSLINNYGSLSRVLDADFDDLIRQPNITENSAVLIKLINAIAREYYLEKHEKRTRYDSTEKIGKYLVDYFYGFTKEATAIMLFNNNMELIECVTVAEGCVSSVAVLYRKLAEIGIMKQAATMILAHNHPDGTLKPSKDDYVVTENIRSAFSIIDLPILEHYIISGDRYNTILYRLPDNLDPNS